MFTLLAIIGVLSSIILFFSMVSSNFQDSSLITAFISMLFSTILCFKLAKMDQQISDNQTEIENLKKHLDIKQEDPVMNSYLQDLDNKKTGD